MAENKVEWNLASLTSMELAELQQLANRAYIKGDYSTAIETLKAMKMTGMYIFNSQERTKLKALEKKINLLLPIATIEKGFNAVENGKILKARLQLIPLYNEYNELLRDLLFKYGFFGALKKDASKIVDIKDD